MSENSNANLFPQKAMEQMVNIKMIPRLNPTAVQYYITAGINMNKCGTCECWMNVRTLFHMTDGLMTSCVPCIKDVTK